MIKNNYPGLFISFEGLDGSGSSTQISLLARKLELEKYKVLMTKEPTNNIIGGLIRGQLTKGWSSSPRGLQLLFAADRDHHLKREVIPALEKGIIVLSDRYAFSTVAFGSLNCDRQWLLELNKYFLEPDLTILLKVSPKSCIERITKSRVNFEFFEEASKMKKIWQTYQWLDKKFASIVMLDGERKIEDIARDIFMIVKKELSKKKLKR